MKFYNTQITKRSELQSILSDGSDAIILNCTHCVQKHTTSQLPIGVLMLFHLYVHPVRCQMVHMDRANTYSKCTG